ncbi:MAG: hypothetical protein ACR2PL_04635 [Dehalococcoidia bacterium]
MPDSERPNVERSNPRVPGYRLVRQAQADGQQIEALAAAGTLGSRDHRFR